MLSIAVTTLLYYCSAIIIIMGCIFASCFRWMIILMDDQMVSPSLIKAGSWNTIANTILNFTKHVFSKKHISLKKGSQRSQSAIQELNFNEIV